MHYFKDMITRLAAHINGRIGTWAVQKWHGTFNKRDHLPTRRRTDAHVQRHCLETVVASGKYNSVFAAVRGIGAGSAGTTNRWVAKSCAEVRAAACISFAETNYLAIAPDGSRIGKHAKELLMTPCSDVGRGREANTVLPPVVRETHRPDSFTIPFQGCFRLFGLFPGFRMHPSCIHFGSLPRPPDAHASNGFLGKMDTNRY